MVKSPYSHETKWTTPQTTADLILFGEAQSSVYPYHTHIQYIHTQYIYIYIYVHSLAAKPPPPPPF